MLTEELLGKDDSGAFFACLWPLIGVIAIGVRLWKKVIKKRAENIFGRLILITNDHFIAINEIKENESGQFCFDFGVVCAKCRAQFKFGWIFRGLLTIKIETEKEEYQKLLDLKMRTRPAKGKSLKEAEVLFNFTEIKPEVSSLFGDKLLCDNKSARAHFKK